MHGGSPECYSGVCVEVAPPEQTVTTIPSTPTTVPTFCPNIYSPVCGIDGNTYSNECYAQLMGVTIAHAGECGQPQQTTTTTISHICNVGGVCYAGGNTGQYNSACQCCYSAPYQSTCENWCLKVDSAKCNADYSSCVSNCQEKKVETVQECRDNYVQRCENQCNQICSKERVNCDAEYPCSCAWYDVVCLAKWSCVQHALCTANNWVKNVCKSVCSPVCKTVNEPICQTKQIISYITNPTCKAGCDIKKATCMVTQIKVRCDEPCTKYQTQCV